MLLRFVTVAALASLAGCGGGEPIDDRGGAVSTSDGDDVRGVSAVRDRSGDFATSSESRASAFAIDRAALASQQKLGANGVARVSLLDLTRADLSCEKPVPADALVLEAALRPNVSLGFGLFDATAQLIDQNGIVRATQVVTGETTSRTGGDAVPFRSGTIRPFDACAAFRCGDSIAIRVGLTLSSSGERIELRSNPKTIQCAPRYAGATPAPTNRRVLAVSSGDSHTCVLLDGGFVRCFGDNSHGQLGLGDSRPRGGLASDMGAALPVVDLGSGVRALSVHAGDRRTCAILATGKVKCWGWNAGGKLGIGSSDDRGDGASEMGDALPELDLGSGRTARALTLKGARTCALLDKGEVKCWGENGASSCSLGVPTSRTSIGDRTSDMGDRLRAVPLSGAAIAIAGGGESTCALLDSGRVQCWTPGGACRISDVDFGSAGAKAIAMGEIAPLCVLRTDGAVTCQDATGAFAVVSLGPGRKAKSIDVGSAYGCAVLDDGSVTCWSLGGARSVWNTTNSPFAPMLLGQRAPVDRGAYEISVDIGAAQTARSVSVGWTHACVVRGDGATMCWGYGGNGRLGRAQSIVQPGLLWPVDVGP